MYFTRMLRLFTKFAELTLTQGTANVFNPQHLKGASMELVQSMFKIGRKAAELERKKLQMEIHKEESEIRWKKLEKRVQIASTKGRKHGPMKTPKKEFDKDDDDFLEDLVVDTNPEELKKMTTYSNLEPGGFITKAEDRKGRLDKRQARIAVAKEQADDDDEDEDDDERETRQLESELRKTERPAEKARDQEEKEKARRFSKCIQSGVFLKQPQAVSLVPMKRKRKTLKTEPIKSADEEDEKDQIPEGFHLQEQSPHCLNMQRAEDFQAYLRQLVLEFEKMLKAGGTDMKAEYGKVIESFFWACKANKQTICNEAVPDDVLASVKDPSCKAWKLKLSGKDNVDPMTLVPEPVIAPQKASDVISLKPDEILKAVKGELKGKTPIQVKELKITIANRCGRPHDNTNQNC